MYDLSSAHKIQEIFDAQVVDIGVYDPEERLVHFRTPSSAGSGFPEEAIALIGFRKEVLATGQSLMINEDVMGRAAEAGQGVISGEAPKAVIYAPLMSAGRPSGVVSVQNM